MNDLPTTLPPDEATGWRGDEHRLQVSAADEAGLATDQVSLELYRKGFIGGLQISDPLDRAMVLRGRTVLDEKQLKPAIRRIFTHLSLGARNFSLRVDNGEFELRIADQVAHGSGDATQAMRRTLLVFAISGLIGLFFLKIASFVSLLVWSAGLLGGASLLRRGIKDGRVRLAARLVDELAKLAEREQLILPPSQPATATPALRSADDLG